MDWAHDPDAPEGSDGGRRYGLAIFAHTVSEDHFPTAKAELIDVLEAKPIRLDHTEVVAAEEILEAVDADSFESKTAFLKAIGETMRQHGWWNFDPETVAATPWRD